jgi:hypothetical protein
VPTGSLKIECATFDRLEEVVRSACGADPRWASPQLEYLKSYLRGDARARTLVIEHPYVDRHYLEEFGAYYFSAFRNGGSATTRIHVFAIEFGQSKLEEWVEDGVGDEVKHAEVQRQLDAAYVGFITVRPIPSAPFGRTILRPYSDVAARSYIPAEGAAGGHAVHLLGFALQARGLPFQQQEQAVGACATVALWSAMSRVARADGGRAPTPYAVTQAATKHGIQDRALPAVSGLDQGQLVTAVRELGYAPYCLKPGSERQTWLMSLKCYLRSGIPTVIVLDVAGELGTGHAVVASGYRIADEEEHANDIRVTIPGEQSELRSAGLTRVYVHDDRFGPYVSMGIDQDEELALYRAARRPEDPAKGAGGKIWFAIFPLYPKLRLSARDLIGAGLDLAPLVRSLLNEGEREELRVEFFFQHGSDYLRNLVIDGGPSAERLRAFVSTTALPRYVGIIRFQLGDAQLIDVICDTTDIRRDHPRHGLVLAIVPFVGKHVEPLRAWLDATALDARLC